MDGVIPTHHEEGGIRMNRMILFLMLVLAAPVFGQSVHKCPQPDGKISYQRAPCADGAMIAIKDNGKVSGVPEQGLTANGLRPGEQAILDQAKQREIDQQKAAEEARRQAAAPPPGKPATNVYDMIIESNRQSSQNLRSLYRALGR